MVLNNVLKNGVSSNANDVCNQFCCDKFAGVCLVCLDKAIGLLRVLCTPNVTVTWSQAS